MFSGASLYYGMYISVDFKISPLQPATDILIAELSELGFESFLESEDGLQAFIPESEWDEGRLRQVRILQQQEVNIRYHWSRIAHQNWNAAWEKSFKPIRIGRECLVRAPFHKTEPVSYDIIIEPKMSFGTGHHETTRLMLEWLLRMEIKDLAVLDMGCGTGVLAILAAMKGAAAVDAIDIDAWSYTNTLENTARNKQGHIRVFQGDADILEADRYDIILANINRNILLEDIPRYALSLKPAGVLLVSGFYLEDLPAISGKCREVNLKYQKNTQKNRWVSAKYVF
jgi:ribosomal protein L11 methyltransferase